MKKTKKTKKKTKAEKKVTWSIALEPDKLSLMKKLKERTGVSLSGIFQRLIPPARYIDDYLDKHPGKVDINEVLRSISYQYWWRERCAFLKQPDDRGVGDIIGYVVEAEEQAECHGKQGNKERDLSLSYEQREGLRFLSKKGLNPTKVVRGLIPSLTAAMALQSFWEKEDGPTENVVDSLFETFTRYIKSEMINDTEHPISLQLLAQTQGLLPGQYANRICGTYITWTAAKSKTSRMYVLKTVELKGKHYWIAFHKKEETAELQQKMLEILSGIEGMDAEGKPTQNSF